MNKTEKNLDRVDLIENPADANMQTQATNQDEALDGAKFEDKKSSLEEDNKLEVTNEEGSEIKISKKIDAPKDVSNLPKFTIKQLLEAGVHFGHKTSRRNTKMSKYIFGVKNKLSIIDLQKTGYYLNESLKVVSQIAKNNGKILFVATKKQASQTVAETAKRCGQFYVNQRWLGGMLTNWQTISKSISTLRSIEKQLENDDLGLNKKEKLVLERKRQKLEDALGGIKDMGGYPDLVFVIDTHRESLAILEAKKIKVPVMAILDTNCNPDNITFPIPGNDDSIKSIRLYCHLIGEAILAGLKEAAVNSGVDLAKNVKKTTLSEPSKNPKEKKDLSNITLKLDESDNKESKTDASSKAKNLVASKKENKTSKTSTKKVIKKEDSKKVSKSKITEDDVKNEKTTKTSSAKKDITEKTVTKDK